jgi:MFS family permease
MTNTSGEKTTAQLNSWHRVILIYFTLFGVLGTSITVRLPLVQDLLGVTPSLLGIILFVGSIGAIGSLNISGRLIEKIGTKPAIVTGLLLMAFAVVCQVAFAVAGIWVGYMIFGFLVGCSYGFADVAINLDGTVLERKLEKSLMPRMHAAYSLGALAGAGLGTIATSVNFPIMVQAVIIAGVQILVVLTTVKTLPSGTGIEETHVDGEKLERKTWLTPTVIFLGIALLSITIAEGSSNDWLAIGLVSSDYNASQTNAGIAYSILMAAMTLTRFFGGNIADRFGKARTLQALAITGVLGILLIIVGAPNIYLAWAGAALWGVGVALGFPLLLSAAGEADHAAKRVAFVAFWGYGAFIVGPPLLGFLGQAWGMLQMYFIIAALLSTAIFFSASAGNKRANG